MSTDRSVSLSSTRAPITADPSGDRSSDVALALVTTIAPCAAAVRATVTVYRASSTCAS